MCIFLVIGDGGNVDENNFARDDQRQSRLDETTIPFVTPEATSTRQTRCISIAPVLFEKKKKKEGAANPRLHSIDEPRFTSPIRRAFSIVTGIHQRCAATRALLSSKTNSFLFILIINLSLLYIYIYMLNRTEIFQTRVKSLPKFFSFPNLAISSSNNSFSLSLARWSTHGN